MLVFNAPQLRAPRIGRIQLLEATAATFFLLSTALLLVAYAGYPLLLSLLPAKSPSTAIESADGNITVIIVARNEAARIGRKIRNLLEQSAAPRILQILVISDHSEDDTVDIVRALAKDDDRILLLELEDGLGKAAGLNLGIAHACSEYIVFSDVRQRFELHAVERLVAAFSDPEVGGVAGELRFENDANLLETYWKYETAIRKLQSRHDSLLGCAGAIYAIRRRLFVKLPERLILDDIWVPAHVVFAGYRVIYQSSAVAIEDRNVVAEEEFGKKVRTLAGNLEILQRCPKILSPTRNRLWWSFLLHKILRVFGPVLLLAALISSIFLPWPWNYMLAGGQAVFYLLAMAPRLVPSLNHNCKLCRICGSFALLNLAAAVAIYKAATHNYSKLWTTRSSGTS